MARKKKPEKTLPQDFLEAYVASRDSVIKKPEVAAVVWASFMKFAVEWLAEDRVLNLGFATLTPTLFRYDWLDVFIRERNIRYASRAKKLEDFEFAKWHLTKARVTAFDTQNKVALWNLLCLPMEGFNRAMLTVEKERRRKCKNESEYHGRMKKVLRTHAKRNHEILKTYLAEATRPNAQLRDSYQFNNPHPTPNIPIGKDGRFQKRMDNNRGADQSVAPSGAEMAVACENEGVHAMPNLQSPEQDVRNGRESLDAAGESGERVGAGAGGLPLLASVEEQHVGQLLVVGAREGNDADGSLAGCAEQLSAGEKGESA